MSPIRQPNVFDLLLVVGGVVTGFVPVWAWVWWKSIILPHTLRQWTMLVIMGLLLARIKR